MPIIHHRTDWKLCCGHLTSIQPCYEQEPKVLAPTWILPLSQRERYMLLEMRLSLESNIRPTITCFISVRSMLDCWFLSPNMNLMMEHTSTSASLTWSSAIRLALLLTLHNHMDCNFITHSRAAGPGYHVLQPLTRPPFVCGARGRV